MWREESVRGGKRERVKGRVRESRGKLETE